MDRLQLSLSHLSTLQIGWLSCSIYHHYQSEHSDIASRFQASITNSYRLVLSAVADFEGEAIATVTAPVDSATSSRS